MTDMIDSKSDLDSSISELVSLGLKTKKKKDSYEVENILACLMRDLDR